jgi:ATP-dependent Lon protease
MPIGCKRPYGDGDGNMEEAAFLASIPREHSIALRLMEDQLSIRPRVPLRFLIVQSDLPMDVKQNALRRLEKGFDSKFEQWIQKALDVPLGKYSAKPVATSVKETLTTGRSEMDAAICGNSEAKMEILRLLGQWATADGVSAPAAIGFEGPPGVGKTTFARAALATTLKRPFCFISLGGAHDGTLVWGHSYTYEGSVPGRIAEEVISSKCMDPVFYFDELDKISKSTRGDEIIHALIHLTDPQQNCDFRDRYLHGIPLDLSRAVFAFSFNDRSAINPILCDRLKIVHCKPPDIAQKLDIAKQFLIPRSVTAIGNQSIAIFDDDVLRHLAARSPEAGVREFNRCLIHILFTLNVAVHGGADIVGLTDSDLENLPVECTIDLCDRLLPQRDFDVQSGMIATMYA